MDDDVNYPTSDIQFLAEMIRRIRRSDQITSAEAHRIDVLASEGHSSSADEVAPDNPIMMGSHPFPGRGGGQV